METLSKKRPVKRRRTPSYKTLYLTLLASLQDTSEDDAALSDLTPTHVVTVEDTIEWQYHIVAPNDEAAENYEQGDEFDSSKGITLVRLKKNTHCSRSPEARPYNPHHDH